MILFNRQFSTSQAFLSTMVHLTTPRVSMLNPSSFYLPWYNSRLHVCRCLILRLRGRLVYFHLAPPRRVGGEFIEKLTKHARGFARVRKHRNQVAHPLAHHALVLRRVRVPREPPVHQKYRGVVPGVPYAPPQRLVVRPESLVVKEKVSILYIAMYGQTVRAEVIVPSGTSMGNRRGGMW